MFGPGKYDDLCTEAREKAKASTLILIVKDGIYGNGFSIQISNLNDLFALPLVLRQLADEVEHDNKRLKR